jgi:hypothetical protein
LWEEIPCLSLASSLQVWTRYHRQSWISCVRTCELVLMVTIFGEVPARWERCAHTSRQKLIRCVCHVHRCCSCSWCSRCSVRAIEARGRHSRTQNKELWREGTMKCGCWRDEVIALGDQKNIAYRLYWGYPKFTKLASIHRDNAWKERWSSRGRGSVCQQVSSDTRMTVLLFAICRLLACRTPYWSTRTPVYTSILGVRSKGELPVL